MINNSASGDTLRIMVGFGFLKADYSLTTVLEDLIGENPIAKLSEFLIGWRNHVFNETQGAV